MTTIEIHQAERSDLRRTRLWFTIEGAIILVLGVLAAVLPAVAGLAAATVFGWMLLLSGLAGFIVLAVSRGQSHPGWRIVSAVAAILAGAIVLCAPLAGLLSIALLVATYLVVNAVASFAMASDQRRASSRSWGWRVLAGLIDLVLAGFSLFLKPRGDAVLVGYVVAVDLIIAGIAMLGLGLAVRQSKIATRAANPAARSKGWRTGLRKSAWGGRVLPPTHSQPHGLACFLPVSYHAAPAGSAPTKRSAIEADQGGRLSTPSRWPQIRMEPTMVDVKVTEDLWASRLLPEGLVERWLLSDGATVSAGDPLVEVRIEDSLHEIFAPASGRLKIASPADDFIEPGSVIASISVR